MFRQTIETYIKQIMDFLLYTKNYFIRTNPVQAMIASVVEGVKDLLTVKKKLKMAQYRLNYHKYQFQKMEQLIAESNQHNFLKGSQLDQKR